MTPPPDTLQELLDRFDPSAIDMPLGRARIRLSVEGEGEWDALVMTGGVLLQPATQTPDAILSADAATWDRIAADLRGGMDAYRAGRLVIRHNLHLGVGFLAATSGTTGRGPPAIRARRDGRRAALHDDRRAPATPVLLLHGLGATKGSFLPTVAALAGSFRTIALDLPGFGDSCKPLGARYHPPFFARAVVDVDGRARASSARTSSATAWAGASRWSSACAIPERVGRLVLLAPSLAWRRERPVGAARARAAARSSAWCRSRPRWVVEAIVHRIIPVARDSWVRAGVDEFLRAYLTPRGRVAFYAAARQIYLEEPHGAKGFWTRLARLEPPALFIWGTHDGLVPIAFAAHVRSTLPSARHLELDCGHVPQIERPDETHAAIAAFLRESAPIVAAGRPSSADA